MRIQSSLRRLRGVFAILYSATLVAAQSESTSRQFETDTRAYLEKLTNDGLPGVAVLVARDGRIVFRACFGFADIGRGIPVTVDTKFRIGSVTKQFTAAAILRLVEDKKLSLTDTVEKFFPGFPRGEKITIHHLLTHTSGIPNFTKRPDFRSRVSRFIAPAELIALFGEGPPDFPPGAGSRYSNSGYFLLGEIVKKISGKSLESSMRETFFEPLAMLDTGFIDSAMPPAGLAVGYSGAYKRPNLALHWDVSWNGGAGGLYSTVGDLYRWSEALFSGKVVSADSLKLMTTSVNLPPEKVNYGYGVAMVPLHGLPSISHGGSLDGWASYLARLPDQHCTVVVLANSDPSVTKRGPADVTYYLTGRLLATEIAMHPSSTIWRRIFGGRR